MTSHIVITLSWLSRWSQPRNPWTPECFFRAECLCSILSLALRYSPDWETAWLVEADKQTKSIQRWTWLSSFYYQRSLVFSSRLIFKPKPSQHKKISAAGNTFISREQKSYSGDVILLQTSNYNAVPGKLPTSTRCPCWKWRARQSLSHAAMEQAKALDEFVNPRPTTNAVIVDLSSPIKPTAIQLQATTHCLCW